MERFSKERLRLAEGGSGVQKRRLVREVAAVRHDGRLEVLVHHQGIVSPVNPEGAFTTGIRTCSSSPVDCAAPAFRRAITALVGEGGLREFRIQAG